jgi:hypothetical protein
VEIVKRSLVLIGATDADSARGENAHPQNSADSEGTTAAAWAVWAWSGADCLRIARFVELPRCSALVDVIWWGSSELNKGQMYFFSAFELYRAQSPASSFN